MGLGWGLLWGTAKLSSSLAHKLNDNINDLKSKTSFSAKKSGYALFGDKIGYDSEGVRDYRALLLPKYVSNNDKQILAQGEYRLGKIKNPRTQEKIPFSIFGEHIFTHQLLIAPSGSGKTYGVIVPAVLSLLENHFPFSTLCAFFLNILVLFQYQKALYLQAIPHYTLLPNHQLKFQ